MSAEVRKATTDLLVELFFDLVELSDTKRFVEVGAKEASASIRAQRVRGVTSVTAFEANPYTYKRFAPKLHGRSLRYEHLALSDTAGSVAFRVMRNEAGDPIANGQGSLLERRDFERGFELVSVRAVTLDGYFADDHDRTAMWIDVEGAAGLVLRGARAVLSDATVVIIEVEERQIWEGDHWLRPAVVAYLHDHGLTPVARDLQSRFQHNLVAVRTDALGDPRVATRLDEWVDGVRSLPTA